MIDYLPAKVKNYTEKSNIGDTFYIQEKYDGVRALCFIDKSGQAQFIGRNIDKNGNKIYYTNKMAHIKFDRYYWNSILDGEIITNKILPGYNGTCGTTSAILNSDNNIFDNLLEYKPFDILQINNVDIRHEPAFRRCIHIHAQPLLFTNRENIKQIFNNTINNGGEGIVIKRADAPYGVDWYKLKKQTTIDAYIIAINEGQGKYINSCGSITLAVMDDEGNDNIICNCPPGDDSMRQTIYNIPELYMNKVVEIACQDITPNLKVTQPRIIRWRTDKGMFDCQLEQLL